MTTPHVVFAHGFTQTAQSWSTIQSGLTSRRPEISTLAVDLPGHGDAADLRCNLWQASDMLAAAGGPGTYVGYSMGGRIALHTALRHPQRVERLVLIGATAGIDDDDERTARRVDDQGLADRIVRSSIAAFIDEWLDDPLFDGLEEAAAMRDDRLRNTTAGLASSLRLCGTGVQDPLWSRLGEIGCPTLLLVGERDDKFRGLGEELAAGIPDSVVTIVAGAGHSVHLEQPDATIDAIAGFIG